jgi:hypothetical protein
MSMPALRGWGVAKWQGTWLWTTHSEVRILPPQSGLSALIAMVLTGRCCSQLAAFCGTRKGEWLSTRRYRYFGVFV